MGNSNIGNVYFFGGKSLFKEDTPPEESFGSFVELFEELDNNERDKYKPTDIHCSFDDVVTTGSSVSSKGVLNMQFSDGGSLSFDISSLFEGGDNQTDNTPIFMYGDHSEEFDDDIEDELDLYGENYCRVKFTSDRYKDMVSSADFDIDNFRGEDYDSLSFNDGRICGISPNSVFSITRLSEQEYLDLTG